MTRTQVIVRDGRIGRDPSRVTEAGGEVLHEYDMDFDPERWPDVGDRITLPNGDEVEVIGVNEQLEANERNEITEHTLTVFVGDVWDDS